MLFDITKINKYGVYSSEKIGVQYYYTVNTRVYTDETKKRFWRVRFMFYFDINDVCEFYEKDSVTKDEINEYKKEIAYSCADSLIAYNKTIDGVITDCNETIRRYA